MKEFIKTMRVDWLDDCINCGEKSPWVFTESRDNKYLFNDDFVHCNCGQSGYIDIQDGNAFVCWDELSIDELKYNKLKIMYDEAIECLMESNYNDENYLRRRGVIE